MKFFKSFLTLAFVLLFLIYGYEPPYLLDASNENIVSTNYNEKKINLISSVDEIIRSITNDDTINIEGSITIKDCTISCLLK